MYIRSKTYALNLTLILIIAITVFNGQPLSGKVRLPHFITDRMVLQRDVDLKIWGWADENEKVTVRFKDVVYHTEPDSLGEWQIVIPPQKAGGPYILEVNEIIIRDVLIGDVWLASGQSNMETPIERLVDRFPEINVSNNHMIRYYKVPTQEPIDRECEDIQKGAKWHSGTASDVMNWTALAYFYAQEAYKHTKVPVGIIVSSKGGSGVESWISQEYLKPFSSELLYDENAADAYNEAQKDKGANKWNNLDLDDDSWQEINVPGRWKEQGLDTKGVVWYRKNFELPSFMEGRHAKLHLGMMVDSDSVFVNGRFVGFTSYMYPPRKYDIPAGILKKGKNNITIRLTANGGNGGFVEDKPYKIISDDFEIDLIGTWKYKVGLDLQALRESKESLGDTHRIGSGLYNGMIYPLKKYKFKGVIWYQGESNAGNPLYEDYLKALIANWRDLYQSVNMPFLLVQLPNYLPKSQMPPMRSGWADAREAQLNITQSVPYTGMAVTYDIGEWNDIHPLNKKDMAYRLFLNARKLAYGEKIVSSGPIYKDMKIEKDKIILTFSELGSGLKSSGGPLKHFAIAGEDKRFVWADAIIKRNKVIVSSKEVPNPVAVRYAWSDNPEEANLQNKEGLLASPFRTDNW